jgi:hypothetical protein
MTNLWLIVLENSPAKQVKQVEAAAPITQYNFKLKLQPGVNKYDVRGKKFGPPPPPQSFAKAEVEHYVIELTSKEPQWYKFRLEAEWYDVANKEQLQILKSQDMVMEFSPEVNKV